MLTTVVNLYILYYNVCVCFTYLTFTEGHMVEWLDS